MNLLGHAEGERGPIYVSLTSLESTESAMMGTQPLKVAVWKRQM